MRAFVEIRKAISTQSELSQQIRELKNNFEERLGEHDVQLMEIYVAMEQFLDESSQKKYLTTEKN